MIKPLCLKHRDTIGVISPSAPVAARCPKWFARGVSHVEAMGFSVLLAEHARAHHGHTAGTIEDGIEDIDTMFSNARVSGMISTIVGSNSNQLSDHLDYDLIQRHPKVLMGYSDVTALLLGIHTMTGLVTFLGPALMPQFGEYDGLHPYPSSGFGPF